MPHLLTVPEAAAALRLSRAKTYELISAGTLPSVKIGGSRRIRSTELAAYIEGLAVAA